MITNKNTKECSTSDDCEQVYIGETGRPLITRFKVYPRYFKYEKTNKSVVYAQVKVPFRRKRAQARLSIDLPQKKLEISQVSHVQNVM